jgi:hypothetical protein
MKSNHVYTQHTLNGKKTKRLSCGCCDMQDFREDYQTDQDKKMIRNFRANSSKEFLAIDERQRSAYHDKLFDEACLRYSTVLKYSKITNC